ncbi:uncharacterized protein VTP21DRAFT_9443 [Calcarisporiella thermophila]|uniref:uncharacterized protein n=1 Tax=Calcarisporiella thermophila TaxID=911321 RepID=UPI0037441FE0
MQIDLDDNIVILDEAHNIEDASREAGSFELNESQLSELQKELEALVRVEDEEYENKLKTQYRTLLHVS